MNRTGDVLILGGGVIGLTTAYFLAKAGVTVLLCDQSTTGSEASWAGAGIIPPSHPEHAQYPFDRLRALSCQLFPAFCQELKDQSGIDNGFHRCGGIEFLDPAGQAAPEEWYGLGVATKSLSPPDLARLEPALASNLGPALLVPEMAQLRNPRHLQALRAACLATQRVTLVEGTPAHGFLVEGHSVKGVRVGNEVLSGARVLVAAGAWTDRLLETVGTRLHIEPVRGQIALLNPGRVLFQRILLWGSRYLVPRRDGLVLIGSTEEHAGFDKRTTAEGIAGLLALGVKLVPALAGAALETTWSGLRPGSPDGLPCIGPVPGFDNLWAASGHFRAGIQLSPGTALLLKEMLLGEPLTMPIDAFRLDRPRA